MYPYRTQCHLIHAETTAIKKNLKKLFVEKQTYPIYALTTADCLVTASTVTQPYPVNNEAIYTYEGSLKRMTPSNNNIYGLIKLDHR